MPLDEYRRKRNFTRSPEPAGDDRLAAKRRQARAERYFCVQKHLATQLHYDFRLEHNGVLLSWAVPRGPSLDPRDKRLAVHVEDHPLEYGTFEGVIPEGYGAGLVMLWDEGTWTPSGDVGEALRKGDLKFTLDGYKLKGSWVLVRTGGRSGGRYGSQGSDDRNWLLIKHRDDWSGPIDITTFAPLSVKSEGDFDDILAAEDVAVWTSNKPAKGGASGRMLAEIVERAARLQAERESTTAPPARPAKGSADRPAAKSKARPGEPASVRKTSAGARQGARAAKSKTERRSPKRRDRS